MLGRNFESPINIHLWINRHKISSNKNSNSNYEEIHMKLDMNDKTEKSKE